MGSPVTWDRSDGGKEESNHGGWVTHSSEEEGGSDRARARLEEIQLH